MSTLDPPLAPFVSDLSTALAHRCEIEIKILLGVQRGKYYSGESSCYQVACLARRKTPLKLGQGALGVSSLE